MYMIKQFFMCMYVVQFSSLIFKRLYTRNFNLKISNYLSVRKMGLVNKKEIGN